jgi:hypothetical protein
MARNSVSSCPWDPGCEQLLMPPPAATPSADVTKLCHGDLGCGDGRLESGWPLPSRTGGPADQKRLQECLGNTQCQQGRGP